MMKIFSVDVKEGVNLEEAAKTLFKKLTAAVPRRCDVEYRGIPGSYRAVFEDLGPSVWEDEKFESDDPIVFSLSTITNMTAGREGAQRGYRISVEYSKSCPRKMKVVTQALTPTENMAVLAALN
jgi:hypothetical protein